MFDIQRYLNDGILIWGTTTVTTSKSNEKPSNPSYESVKDQGWKQIEKALELKLRITEDESLQVYELARHFKFISENWKARKMRTKALEMSLLEGLCEEGEISFTKAQTKLKEVLVFEFQSRKELKEFEQKIAGFDIEKANPDQIATELENRKKKPGYKEVVKAYNITSDFAIANEHMKDIVWKSFKYQHGAFFKD